MYVHIPQWYRAFFVCFFSKMCRILTLPSTYGGAEYVYWYGVATISRLVKITGLLRKRAL